MIRNGSGMFSIGNINPLSMIVGKNIPVSEINIAVCCESVDDEISNPNARHVSVNKILSKPSNAILPLIGTSSANTLNNNMEVIFIVDNSK